MEILEEFLSKTKYPNFNNSDMKLFTIVVVLTLSAISIVWCGDEETKPVDYGPLIGIDLGTTYSW